jgi:membrane fusion protein, multidrug efflux system
MKFFSLQTLFLGMKNKFNSLSFKSKILTGTFVFIAILVGVKTHQIYQAIQMGKMFANPPPTTVVLTRVMKKDWIPSLTSIGTFEAQNGVDITPEITGIVKKIAFTAGTHVKKDDTLVQMDTDILNAQLKEARAKRDLAALNFERTESLLQSQATSAALRDESKANYEAAQAQFEQIQALLAQKTITAPFDGRVGIRQVQLGQFISPTNVITSLESVDPILVNFTISEQNIRKIKLGQEVTVTVTAYPNLQFNGKITAIDSKIASDTKSIKVQASLSNTDQDHLLIPGMFAAVKIIQPPLKNQIIIPSIAVDYTLYGNSVYVIHANEQGGYSANRIFVKTGDEADNEVVVLSGLTGDETIVKTGQVKLHDGASVSFEEIE